MSGVDSGLVTGVYRLSRTDMARLASIEYLATFWWAAVGIPAAGILFLIVGRGLLQVIGMFALIWPFSIPARAVMVTSKSSRLYVGGVQMTIFADRLDFQGQTTGRTGKRLRMVLPRDEVRDVRRRGDYLLIRTITYGFIPVARSAFASAEEEDAFMALGRKAEG